MRQLAVALRDFDAARAGYRSGTGAACCSWSTPAVGRVGDGIVATSELIAVRAEAATARGELVGRAGQASSAGAGAESRTETGGGYARPQARTAVVTHARPDPLETVTAYVAVMAAHDASADLDLYTAGTRPMLAGHVVTRAQMDNLVRTSRACPPPRVRSAGDAAVVEHPGESEPCAPWLLRRGADGLWRLDLVTMQRALSTPAGRGDTPAACAIRQNPRTSRVRGTSRAR